MSSLVRYSEEIATVNVDTVLADCEEIPFADYAGGMINVPSASALTSLTWYCATAKGGTYLAAHDENGDAIVSTVAADGAYPIPAALYPCRWLKAVGNADGTVNLALKG